MTALRPEREGASYEQEPYEAAGAFEAAVQRLDDPLNDPLPGQHPSPWFRATDEPQEPQPYSQPQPDAQQPLLAQPSPQPEQEWYDPQGYVQDWYGGAQQAPQAPHPPQVQQAQQPAYVPPVREYEARPPRPVPDDETVALRTADTRGAAGPDTDAYTDADASTGAETDTESDSGAPERERAAAPVGTGGRAARRKAAKQGGRRSVAPAQAPEPASPPRSRLEARRAARASKPSTGEVASRAIGETFITIGVLMLLFVTYQLWWSNIRAHQQAGSAAHHLQDDWANGKREPDKFAPGQGFAIMHIPKLDVVVPIAEGISKTKVLDRGMVGHYGKDSIETAMPSAKTGNFAVAGHRNTHGEPFRYINRLQPGDPIVVETQDTYYVYKMTSILPQTPPSNTTVINPIPQGSGFTAPGRYITLTTCTPEFTSTYRMIVWGKMVEERPRSKGKPDALVQ
ncbi:class E sortase [Streptomyces sp. NBC_01003]|uniref:class E sortase n=1 Tax=Streptomyces sp. NBC_01003 TaxID=2903714 RepID=UPI00386582C8|nr:class E sortase [Streptomyces sp. NBC_01003]